MALPQDFLLALHDRSDIVEVVESSVDIKKRGRTYSALCPFHNEKTPSFVVYPDTQSFYCFGCGKGGDVISYVMQKENLDYIEAVRQLAARAGMPMPEDAGDDTYQARKKLIEMNKLAARFFFERLNSDSGRDARGYLRKRGLSDATITKFGIGWAPNGWSELRDYLRAKDFSENELADAGLCTRSQKNDNVYDFFRERVMFPIIDVRGNVVAFSGRTMGTDPRKYLNTRDTPLFKKSRTLFALNIVKNTATRQIIVAEGQMDVIAIHQAGLDNAVAALGTALTDEHTRMISQYADEVVLAYDGDEAGQKATKRAIDMFRPSGILVKVLKIEDAKDPDEYIKKYGAPRFKSLISDSGTSIDYELKRSKAKYDLATNEGKVQYLGEASQIIAKLPLPAERDLYAGVVAGETDVGKQSMLLQVEQNRSRARSREQKKADAGFARSVGERFGMKSPRSGDIASASSERKLVALMYANPDMCRVIKERVSAEQFVSKEMGEIFDAIAESALRGDFAGLTSLSGTLSPERMSQLTALVAEHRGINFCPDDADLYIDKINGEGKGPDEDKLKEMDPESIQRIVERKKKNNT